MSDNHDTLSDLLEPQGSNYARITKPTQAATGDEPEYSAFARGRIGRRPQMMLALQKCSGEVEVLPYSMLRRIQTDNPDRSFTLSFVDVQITIEGQNMTRLFHYVCEHRAVEIVEAERTVAMTSDDETVVTRIIRKQS